MPGALLYDNKPYTRQELVINKPNARNVPYIPPEIVRIILALLKDDKKTLFACALVNHTFNLHVTPILYRTVSLSLPLTFTLFAKVTTGESQRSRMIRHLDLSSFSTIGLQKSDATIQKVVTPNILIPILRSCTMLETFSVSETLESAITSEVLRVLAFECKKIKTLDFCGLSNKQSGEAFASLAEDMGRVKLVQHYDDDEQYSFSKVDNVALSRLQRLSLHECPIISDSTMLTLLAHSPNLSHLDLGGCSISDATLNFLATETNAPQTLTHLLLARCKNISSEAIASLVVECKQLEVLNLYGERDIATAISEYDLTTILTSSSAKKFKTLDIGSSHITPRILYTIQENCKSLTHLGIAKAGILSISHLNDFLTSMPGLQYIDLTAVPCLNPLNTNILLSNLQKYHSLRIVEMSAFLLKKLSVNNGWKINDNYSRRCYYFKQQTHGGKQDRIISRKLDVAESGPENMSKIFQYYSFSV